MLNVEFHCHTRFSKDSLTDIDDLLAACQRKNVDRVVITDHNTIEGALLAHQFAPERVIVGEEIMTNAGELLAAFVTEEVPRGLPPDEAISRLRQQGAFISVSHPFDVLRSGHWEQSELVAILPRIDAIETFNARCLRPVFNQRAQAFAQKHNMPGTAGSDAHMAFEIGQATLRLPDFHNPDTLRAVIHQGRFQGKLSGAWVHFYSTYAKWHKRVKSRNS